MVDRSAIEAMPFTSQPLFVDTRTWVQQQAYRGSVENLHLPLTVKEPTPQSRTGIEGTKPVSMADRARLVHLPLPEHGLRCPRCDSSSTKFCYFNNYNLSQPRHFCKTCRRYWTRGGSLRNVPVGGGCRKTKKTKRTSTSVIASSSRSADTLTHPRHLVPEVIASQLPPTVYQPIEQFGLAADIGLNVGGNMPPMFSPLEFSGETENGGANHWRLPEFQMHQLSSYMNAFEQQVMFANGGGGSEVQNAMIPPFSDVILGRVQEEEVEGEATKTEGSSTGSGSKLIELQGLGSPFWSYV